MLSLGEQICLLPPQSDLSKPEGKQLSGGSARPGSQSNRKAAVTQPLCQALSWEMPGPSGRGNSTAPTEESKLHALRCNSYVFPGNRVLQHGGGTPTKMKTAINTTNRRREGESIVFPSLPLPTTLGVLSNNVLPQGNVIPRLKIHFQTSKQA